jgi:hypothetical protein
MDLLLGIDDTDVLGHQPGTGRVARELGAHLQQAGLARQVGVVRQQLLVDPRIPYTSHNSPACLILDAAAGGNGAADRLFEEAARYVAAHSAAGSDPGLGLAERAAVAGEIVAFGYRAGSEVLTKEEASETGRRAGIRLRELGGTGGGIIGALAAVGLTADGNAGRFLELGGGLRHLGGVVPAAVLRRLGMTLLCVSRNGEPVPAGAEVDTGERVRPRLIRGRPVLFLERTEDGWRCFDRKKPYSAGEPQGGE